MLLLAMLVFLGTHAQSTTPRFGTTANQDNTGRALTYKWVTKTDAVAADSLKLTPSAWHTVVRVNSLADSVALVVSSTTKCYTGDNITIVATGTSGGKLKFVGTNFQTAGTATLSSGARAVINLVFDGAKWVEASRVVQ